MRVAVATYDLRVSGTTVEVWASMKKAIVPAMKLINQCWDIKSTNQDIGADKSTFECGEERITIEMVKVRE